MLDAIFINPPNHEPKLLQAPVSIGTLAELSKAEGLHIKLIDLQFAIWRGELNFPENTLRLALDKILQAPAHTYVFSVFLLRSTTFPWIYELSRGIKERFPTAKIVLGGGQFAGMKEAVFEANPWLDVLVLGEMESTICDLIRFIKEGRALKNIPKIIYLDGNKIPRVTSKLLEAVDLNRLPLQPFTEEYYGTGAQVCVEAGRGCNETCIFCSCRLTQNMRAKSPQRILYEIKTILDKFPDAAGQHTIVLEAENLAADPDFLPAFAAEKTYSTIEFQYACFARLDDLDDSRIAALIESGCRLVYIGLESASENQLKAMRKRIHPADTLWKIRTLTSSGVLVNANFMVGYPDETLEELEATLTRMAQVRWSGAMVSASFIRAEPGSKLELMVGPERDLFVEQGYYFKELESAGINARVIPRPFAIRLWGIKNSNYDLVSIVHSVENMLFLLAHYPVTLHILHVCLGISMHELIDTMPEPIKTGEPITPSLNVNNAGEWLMDHYRPQSGPSDLLYRNIISYEILRHDSRTQKNDEYFFDFDVIGAYSKVRQDFSYLDRYLSILRGERYL